MIKYYYIDDVTRQQQGPFPLDELQGKNIRPETMVWRSGMPDWKRADSVEELAFLFNSRIPLPHEKTEPVRQPLDIRHNTQPSSYTPGSAYRNEDSKWNNVVPMPKNWLLESILLSIFCCSPVSVVGIFFASKVESLYYSKDFAGATRASNNARNWSLAGILFIPVCYMLFIIFAAVVRVLAF